MSMRITFIFLVFLFSTSAIVSQVLYPTRLTNTYCYNYTLPSLTSNFYAIKKPCDGYVFTVINQNTLESSEHITYGSVYGRGTNLSFFEGSNIQYGTTYQVKVQTWRVTPDNRSGPAAVDCYVQTPASGTQSSKLTAAYCGATLQELYSPIYAEGVVGAEAYMYELTNSQGQSLTFEKSSGTLRAFSLFDFDNNSFVNYSTTYTVRVKVKTSGSYGSYGQACTITTPSNIPISKLEYKCNSTIPLLNSPLAAIQIPNAEAYRFRVTDGTHSTIIYPAGYVAVLIPVANATYVGDPISWVTYFSTVQVEVAVFVDGLWQDYGEICNVTIMPDPTNIVGPCPKSLSTFDDVIEAEYTEADNYIFEIRKTQDISVVEQVIRPNAYFRLPYASSQFNEFSTSYQIRVKFSKNGLEQDFGNWCEIITPPDPNDMQIVSQVFASAGTMTTIQGVGSLSYTMGESIIWDETLNGNYLSQGFQSSEGPLFISDDPVELVVGPTVDFKIYPNPFSEKIFLLPQKEDEKSYDVNVFDSRGSLIKKLKLNQSLLEIDLKGQPQGIYYIRIMDFEGHKMASYRIIKSSEIN